MNINDKIKYVSNRIQTQGSGRVSVTRKMMGVLYHYAVLVTVSRRSELTRLSKTKLSISNV